MPDYGPLRGNGTAFRDVGRHKVVVEGVNGPGGSVGSDGGIRSAGRGGRYGWRSRGGIGKLNHGIN